MVPCWLMFPYWVCIMACLMFFSKPFLRCFPTSVAAKITTRPGQVGACNGYILEGDELQTFLNDRHDLKLSQESRSATNDPTSMLNSWFGWSIYTPHGWFSSFSKPGFWCDYSASNQSPWTERVVFARPRKENITSHGVIPRPGTCWIPLYRVLTGLWC